MDLHNNRDVSLELIRIFQADCMLFLVLIAYISSVFL